MADYRLTMHEALHSFPIAVALSLLPAAQERRGAEVHGPDFADRAAAARLAAEAPP